MGAITKIAVVLSKNIPTTMSMTLTIISKTNGSLETDSMAAVICCGICSTDKIHPNKAAIDTISKMPEVARIVSNAARRRPSRVSFVINHANK